MEIGYVFFKVNPGERKDFIETVKRISAVKEAHLVMGDWDAIAKVEAPTIEDLEKVYFNEIDRIENINRSKLQIVACPRTRK